MRLSSPAENGVAILRVSLINLIGLLTGTFVQDALRSAGVVSAQQPQIPWSRCGNSPI
jgi:hypothetical protein